MTRGTFSSLWTLTKPVSSILAEDVAWEDFKICFLRAGSSRN